MRTSTRGQFWLLQIIFVCSCVLILSGCKKTPQRQILGKWNVDGQQTTVEYLKDGTYITAQNGQSSIGSYRFLDDSHLELNITGKVGTNTIKVILNCAIVFHGDKADLTATVVEKPGAPPVSQTLHYTRVD
jgi:hypothetical protein